MSTNGPDNPRLLPRNAAAGIRAALTAGNPVSTRLESGVGNCFPGLECDLRNLERRFFPYLTVEIVGDLSAGDSGQAITIATADVGSALADPDLTPQTIAGFRRLGNPNGSLRGDRSATPGCEARGIVLTATRAFS
jgi:hypothetical protein